MLGVCEEELLGSQRSGAQGRTHERKERTAEKEKNRTEKKGGRKVTVGLRVTTKSRAFTAGEMVLNRGRP